MPSSPYRSIIERYGGGLSGPTPYRSIRQSEGLRRPCSSRSSRPGRAARSRAESVRQRSPATPRSMLFAGFSPWTRLSSPRGSSRPREPSARCSSRASRLARAPSPRGSGLKLSRVDSRACWCPGRPRWQRCRVGPFPCSVFGSWMGGMGGPWRAGTRLPGGLATDGPGTSYHTRSATAASRPPAARLQPCSSRGPCRGFTPSAWSRFHRA